MGVTQSRGGYTAGVILIVLGILFLIGNLIPEFDFGKYWPVLLIALGISLLAGRREQRNSQEEHR